MNRYTSRLRSTFVAALALMAGIAAHAFTPGTKKNRRIVELNTANSQDFISNADLAEMLPKPLHPLTKNGLQSGTGVTTSLMALIAACGNYIGSIFKESFVLQPALASMNGGGACLHNLRDASIRFNKAWANLSDKVNNPGAVKSLDYNIDRDNRQIRRSYL